MWSAVMPVRLSCWPTGWSVRSASARKLPSNMVGSLQGTRDCLQKLAEGARESDAFDTRVPER